MPKARRRFGQSLGEAETRRRLLLLSARLRPSKSLRGIVSALSAHSEARKFAGRSANSSFRLRTAAFGKLILFALLAVEIAIRDPAGPAAAVAGVALA